MDRRRIPRSHTAPGAPNRSQITGGHDSLFDLIHGDPSVRNTIQIRTPSRPRAKSLPANIKLPGIVSRRRKRRSRALYEPADVPSRHPIVVPGFANLPPQSHNNPPQRTRAVHFGPSPYNGPHVYIQDALRLVRGVAIPAIKQHPSTEALLPTITLPDGKQGFAKDVEDQVTEFMVAGLEEMISADLTGLRKICRLDEDGVVRPVAYAAYVVESGEEAKGALKNARKAKKLWKKKEFAHKDVDAPQCVKMAAWLNWYVKSAWFSFALLAVSCTRDIHLALELHPMVPVSYIGKWIADRHC